MMSEVTWLNFLRIMSLICNGIGLIVALAFLFGPKTLSAISKFLDAYHSSIDLEKLLLSKARIILGVTLLIITALMMALVLNIRV